MGKTPNTDSLGHPGAKGTGASGRDGAVSSTGGNPGIKHSRSGGTHSASNIAPLGVNPSATAGERARNTSGGSTVPPGTFSDREKATRDAKNAGSGKGFQGRR